MISAQDIIHDLIITVPTFIWILFVIRWLSRWVYDLALENGYPDHSATYFGRKVIHIFAAGLMTLSIPLFYKEPLVPFISGIALAFYTFYFRWKKNLQDWYQVKENFNEVNFCIMWSFSILLGWFIDKSFWLGVIPALFISFGDGITGIVRNLRYRKRSKSWEGSLAMLFVCLAIGGLKMGWAGIVAGLTATLFETWEVMDDNVSIVVFSFSLLLVFKLFAPHLTTPFLI
ncbi:MAG: dolichol kinase [Candidatus Nealsonbacteria bacterium]|nr:dolichol kinase [Candidatus Nealsonbacteria bacterium]